MIGSAAKAGGEAVDYSEIEARGLVLLGCGKMGSAMLEGWIGGGLDPASVHVIDPAPSDALKALADGGLRLNADLPDAPAICILAVKPQVMDAALPQVTRFGGGRTLILSIAAGIPIARFEDAFGTGTPIIRAMPNTPAAVGAGITALVGNPDVTPDRMHMAQALLSAVGETVAVPQEAAMDAVTGVSGSGPAYVFYLIEALAAAGIAEGLDEATAMRLAKATVAGAGKLAMHSDEPPAQLRKNVTSPGGTTAAGLAVLMDDTAGLGPLVRQTVRAAAARSRELAE